MNEAREIAAQLGMRTADQVPPPAPEPVRRDAKIRWTERRRDLFAWLAPVSISLVATDGPVSVTLFDPGAFEVRQRIGHNRAVWPMRTVNGSVARDAATTTWDKSPFARVGTQKRLWTLREAQRDKLALAIVDRIVALSEAAEQDGGHGRMRNGFHDVGPHIDLAMFEFELQDIAKRLGVLAFGEEELARWFDSLSRRVDGLQAKYPDVRWGERLVCKMAWQDVEVWERDLKGGR